MFSGAEGIKTQEQANVFGGTAGEAYDRCYHQACDGLANVNLQALDELGDAAANATCELAMRKRPLYRASGKKAKRDRGGKRGSKRFKGDHARR